MKRIEAVRYGEIDPAVEARIDDLMGKMTPEEKIGQLVQVTPGMIPDVEDRIRAGGIGSIFTIDNLDKITQLQKLAVEESRLGIPLITGNDVIHGFRTIFPIPLGESCSWDLELIAQTARAAAEESSATGTDWTFAPMVDIGRDPRWGRVAEGSGEDVYLGSEIGKARVRGFQSDGLASGRRVVACPKHYVAYGAAEGGREYNSVDISERSLRDVYLPPFKAAFDEGAGTAMSAFNDLNGVPTSGNVFTLRTILREEWGWQGMVVSDFESIKEMIAHGYAADLKDAGRLGMLAGVDMDMMAGAYSKYMGALIREGAVPEGIVDEAVRRVLRLKIQLGLFEKPYADPELVEGIVLSEEKRALALKAAQECMVLLKNEGGLLPLSASDKRVALIGPLADSRKDMLGTWSFFGSADNADTVVEGFGTYQDGVIHVPGCGVKDGDPADIDAAVEIAKTADVVVLVVGESEDMSGEAHSRTKLGLPGRQQELVDAIVATGKPVALVLMCGRAMVATQFTDKVDALLVAWHGGTRAGQAV
ncbi:MAG: glycoside hydrolase family 3 N-terminal domain-containing protein, partial [Chloroflexia bacterium]